MTDPFNMQRRLPDYQGPCLPRVKVALALVQKRQDPGLARELELPKEAINARLDAKFGVVGRAQ